MNWKKIPFILQMVIRVIPRQYLDVNKSGCWHWFYGTYDKSIFIPRYWNGRNRVNISFSLWMRRLLPSLQALLFSMVRLAYILLILKPINISS